MFCCGSHQRLHTIVGDVGALVYRAAEEIGDYLKNAGGQLVQGKISKKHV